LIHLEINNYFRALILHMLRMIRYGMTRKLISRRIFYTHYCVLNNL